MTRGPRIVAVAAAVLFVAAAALAVRGDDEAPHDRASTPVALRAAHDDGSQDGPPSTDTSVEGLPSDPPATPVPAASTAERANGSARPGTGNYSLASTTTTTSRRSGSGGTATTTTTSQEPPGGDCSSPRTCDRYVLHDGPNGKGWRPGADGVVRIRFHLNVKPPVNCGITEDTLETAYLRMTQVIESTHPGIRFEYLGRTDRDPTRGDGYTDFAYGTHPDNVRDSEGYWIETDIIRNTPGCPQAQLGWEPCEQRDGSCGKAPSGRKQIEHTMIHELIHTLGLGDLTGGETYGISTMNDGGPSGSRFRITLDLGTVKGLRKLVPTSAAWPAVYEP